MTCTYSNSRAHIALLALVICTALLVSSCSLSLHKQGRTTEFAQASVVQPAPRLAQMGFGQQIEFSLCAPAACPAVTPKTLAPSLSPSSQIFASPPQTRLPTTASPLDDGEKIVAASPPVAADPASPPRHATDSAIKMVTVHFRFDDASLSDAGKAALDAAVAEVLDARHIVATGRTDSIGSTRANSVLAAARARAVHDYLLDQYPRLAPVLKFDSKGTCCYVALNDTKQGRSLNRRVDVRFIRDEEPQP
ncbi:MAG: OmpA family protein [Rhodoferax sp.]|uniref:OmpA family protein n=1 Tax=Rhodoferax sp. TaxID=50421 RepID=UPI00261A7065|nr:OmpA family protein [Rhodoferax sp.]MDD5332892.1 OmpA family protein [Rhodoferax sp.]